MRHPICHCEELPKATTRQSRSNHGFSLTEVSVAAVILALSLLAIYGVYIRTYKAAGRAEIKEVARAIAQQTMEDVVNLPFANVALWVSSSPTPPLSYTFQNKDGSQVTEPTIRAATGSQSDYATYQQTQNKLGVTYTITTIVTWHDDDDDQLSPQDPDPNDYKRIRVSVDWPENTSPVVLDRFVSMYFRPYANSKAAAAAGEFRLNDGSNYAGLGSTNLESYTGGNKTSKAEAKGFSTTTYDSSSNIAWVEEFTDDDSGAEYPAESHSYSDESINQTDTPPHVSNNSPIFWVNGAQNSAYASAAALKNIIDLTSQPWQDGEFLTSDGWPNTGSEWPSPPTWSDAWSQPSAISKSTLINGFYWNYVPALPPDKAFKLFRTGESRAGNKSVITSETSNNKVVTRSWAKVSDVKIAEMPGAPDGIISIGRVEARVETEANGDSSGSRATVYWRLFDFTVYGFSTVAEVDGPEDIPDISTLPADHVTRKVLTPGSWITVGDITDVEDGNTAQANVNFAIKIVLNSDYYVDGVLTLPQGTWDITVPASTVTLGTAQANVSYTTM